MLQRIQTLYLLVSLVLAIIMYFAPVAKILAEDNQLLVFKNTGLFDDTNGERIIKALPVIILLSVIVFLYSLSVMLFKWRIIQIRLCVFNILLLFGLVGLTFYYLSIITRKTEAIDHQYCIDVLYPVICIILTYLAYRAIRKDERLIRSIDRIR